jgi:hypothetical protein
VFCLTTHKQVSYLLRALSYVQDVPENGAAFKKKKAEGNEHIKHL